MTSLIKFSPLYGVYSEEPLCYLLEIDDFRFLLDCGWDERFNEDQLHALRPVASTIDAVLISHPDLEHLGGLAYAVGQLGLDCPIYGTIPVFKMGQMFLYDAFISRNSNEDFTVFSLDDVDAAFDKFVQLKYSQHLRLQGKGAGIEITPYAAGHMLGGTIWRVTKETDDVIYAVDYNHKMERHLNPTVLESFKRPMLLITDAFNATTNQTPRRQRDKELMDSILQTLRAGGNVLIPNDTAGRTLELLMCLNQYWGQQRLHYPVVFLTNVAFRTIDFAKSQLEWMSDDVQDAFDNHRENPFDFQNIDLFHTLKDMEEIEDPVVVLTSFGSLETGFSRELFLRWADDPKNTIIFTQRPPEGSLASLLSQSNTGSAIDVNLVVKRKVLLEGEELEEFKRQKKLASDLLKTEERDENEPAPEEEIPAEETDLQAIAYSSINKFFQDGGYDLIINSNTPAYPMYPCYETVMKYDEYGEAIDPAIYETIDELDLGIHKRDEQEMEVDTPKEEEPTKCLIEKRILRVQCRIQSIDFDGRSDARSIKAILANVAPRKLILVHGSEDATSHLQKECERTLQRTCGMIAAPKSGDWVDVTSEANVFKIRLKDSLMKSLTFARMGGTEYSVAHVDGVIHKTSEGIPMLEEIPNNEVTPGHNSVFVGEIRIPDFKQALAKTDCPAEFSGGVLIANSGLVAVRKEETTGSGSVIVEGLLSEDFFKVRSLLYDQFLEL